MKEIMQFTDAMLHTLERILHEMCINRGVQCIYRLCRLSHLWVATSSECPTVSHQKCIVFGWRMEDTCPIAVELTNHLWVLPNWSKLLTVLQKLGVWWLKFPILA